MRGLALFLVTVISFIGINVYFRRATYKAIDRELRNLPWKDLSVEEYMEKCYHLISEKYQMISHCYLRKPWTNFFYRNMFKSKSLPCHMYALIFNRFMQKKIGKKNAKIKFVTKLPEYPWIHFFSKVKLKDRWVNIDVWGRKRGVPYGKTIHEIRYYCLACRNNP